MKYSANSLEKACSHLNFDPNEDPGNTLKAFQEFAQHFQLQYDGLYSDPPKVPLEAAIKRQKIMEATQKNLSPKPAIEQFDQICEQAKALNKKAKFLGMCLSSKFYGDWCAAALKEKKRKSICWERFVKTMSAYYKPTQNITERHFHFRSNILRDDETFIAF